MDTPTSVGQQPSKRPRINLAGNPSGRSGQLVVILHHLDQQETTPEVSPTLATMLLHKDLPVLSFQTPVEFDHWLSLHHTQEQGFWLRYFKKGSGLPTITHPQAVEVALCWGWIDGVLNKYDEGSYLVRFTPRRPRSMWSKVNIANVERLIESGRMKPSGMIQVENAKQDGRWDQAYEPASKMEVPADLIGMITNEPAANAFFQTLNKANRYAIAFRLARIGDSQKRAKKMNQIVEMLRNKEKFHD